MEHHKAMTSDLTIMNSNNNNNSNRHYHHQHHNRRKKRTVKQQQLMSLSPSITSQVKSVAYIDPNTNQANISLRDQIAMKNPLSWKRRWSKWFSSCGSERIYVKSNPMIISIKVKFYYSFFFFNRFNKYTCCVYK